MKLLLVCLVIVLVFIILKLCPKFDNFESPLNTPKIIRATKDKSNAIVEWYDHNPKVEEYILLYVDIEKLSAGVWVQSKVRCDTKRCKIILQNLRGTNYKLAIISKMGDKLSVLKPSDIISFSDDKPYSGIAVLPKDRLVAEGDNKPLKESESHSESDQEQKNNSFLAPAGDGKKGSGETPSPSPAPNPLLDCSGGYVKLKNINSQEDLESAEIVPQCQEMENLSEYTKKPFYHKTLERIFY